MHHLLSAVDVHCDVLPINHHVMWMSSIIFKKKLEFIQKQGLTLQISKCSILRNYVNFLGYELDQNGLMPGRIKTLAVKNLPVPMNLGE